MYKFEFDDLEKFAKEWDIKIEKRISKHGIAVLLPDEGGKIWNFDFCAALRYMEDLRVKNMIEEKDKENNNFLGRRRLYGYLKKKPAESLTTDELELFLKLAKEFGDRK